MRYLPLANLMHHKLGSVLSALGIGIGVCMLVTVGGLSRGSVEEVIDRWNSIRADLVAYPVSAPITFASGGVIPLQAVDMLGGARDSAGQPLAARVCPVYLARHRVGGDDHTVFGITPGDFDVFAGSSPLQPGSRWPDAQGRFRDWIQGRYAQAAQSEETVNLSQQELAEHGGLEAAIDSRLARALGKGVGDSLSFADHNWSIVGIFRAGAVSRVIVPMATLQNLASESDRATLLFMQLTDPAQAGPAAGELRKAVRGTLGVVPISRYQAMLMESLGMMYVYVDAVNTIAMVIAFLFIMVTLYTMVLQRTREIAILKSMGAGRVFILRQVLAESIILTAVGTAGGIGLAYAAGWGIERLAPLLTVSISWHWIGVAIVSAGAGSIIAALYPAWRAVRVDVAEALTLE